MLSPQASDVLGGACFRCFPSGRSRQEWGCGGAAPGQTPWEKSCESVTSANKMAVVTAVTDAPAHRRWAARGVCKGVTQECQNERGTHPLVQLPTPPSHPVLCSDAHIPGQTRVSRMCPRRRTFLHAPGRGCVGLTPDAGQDPPEPGPRRRPPAVWRLAALEAGSRDHRLSAQWSCLRGHGIGLTFLFGKIHR